MLTLNNVKINLQNFGTILGIFLSSKDKSAIEQQYFSFYNHEATGGELEWWSDTCAMFWIYSTDNKHEHRTAEEKLLYALAMAALAETINKGQTKGSNPWPDACETAWTRYEQIEHVTWLQTTKVWDMFDMGDSVRAEKGTGNFDDDVLGTAVTHGKDALEMTKHQHLSLEDLDDTDKEEDTEYEEKGDSKGV